MCLIQCQCSDLLTELWRDGPSGEQVKGNNQLQKEELVSLPYLAETNRNGWRLCFGKGFQVIKRFSQIPRDLELLPPSENKLHISHPALVPQPFWCCLQPSSQQGIAISTAAFRASQWICHTFWGKSCHMAAFPQEMASFLRVLRIRSRIHQA